MAFYTSILYLSLAVTLAIDLVIAMAVDGDEQRMQTNNNLKESIILIPDSKFTFIEISEAKALMTYWTEGTKGATDTLIASGPYPVTFPTPTSFQLTMTHTGNRELTCVELFFTQGSNVNKVYFSKGGIGQTSATIIVETYQTQNFECTANVYGTDP